ncbi:hypothetical protein IE53DRAFT_370626 [Violaceomyces palustris]|uniref:Uncharacterized protein n=1 Tax=Violaceomyces palustris TaxID=1673888 RepID=A0ACD0NRJ0_9BASI|nr:hypothetical protein IE53DRAFT_370626 [Violaceomyces palustris]
MPPQYPSPTSQPSSSTSPTPGARPAAPVGTEASATPPVASKKPRKAKAQVKSQSDMPSSSSTPNLDQPPFQQTSRPLARAILVCKRCRSKKIKCDQGFPSCGSCVKANEVCVGLDPATGREVSRSYITELEERVALLEKELEDARQTPSTTSVKMEGDGSSLFGGTRALTPPERSAHKRAAEGFDLGDSRDGSANDRPQKRRPNFLGASSSLLYEDSDVVHGRSRSAPGYPAGQGQGQGQTGNVAPISALLYEGGSERRGRLPGPADLLRAGSRPGLERHDSSDLTAAKLLAEAIGQSNSRSRDPLKSSSRGEGLRHWRGVKSYEEGRLPSIFPVETFHREDPARAAATKTTAGIESRKDGEVERPGVDLVMDGAGQAEARNESDLVPPALERNDSGQSSQSGYLSPTGSRSRGSNRSPTDDADPLQYARATEGADITVPPPEHTAKATQPAPFPPIPAARKLVDAYFQRVNPQCPILNQATFMPRFEKACKVGLERARARARARGHTHPSFTAHPSDENENENELEIELESADGHLFHLVLAIASAMSWTRPDSSAENHHEAAMRYLDPRRMMVSKEGQGLSGKNVINGRDTLEQLQCLLLTALYSMMRAMRPGVWYCLGVALRLATGIGLHAETHAASESSEVRPEGGETLAEKRRRLFWCTYSLDRQVCVHLRRPFGIADTDIRVQLPWHDECLQMEYEPEPGEVLLLQEAYGDDVAAAVADRKSAEAASALAALGVDGGERLVLDGRRRRPAKLDASRWVSMSFFKMRIFQSEIHNLLHQQGELPRRFNNFEQWKVDMLSRLASWRRKAPSSKEQLEAGGCSYNPIFLELNYRQTLLLIYSVSPRFPNPTKEDLANVEECCRLIIDTYELLSREGQMNYTWMTGHNVYTASSSYLWAIWSQQTTSDPRTASSSVALGFRSKVEEVDHYAKASDRVLQSLKWHNADKCRSCLKSMFRATIDFIKRINRVAAGLEGGGDGKPKHKRVKSGLNPGVQPNADEGGAVGSAVERWSRPRPLNAAERSWESSRTSDVRTQSSERAAAGEEAGMAHGLRVRQQRADAATYGGGLLPRQEPSSAAGAPRVSGRRPSSSSAWTAGDGGLGASLSDGPPPSASDFDPTYPNAPSSSLSMPPCHPVAPGIPLSYSGNVGASQESPLSHYESHGPAPTVDGGGAGRSKPTVYPQREAPWSQSPSSSSHLSPLNHFQHGAGAASTSMGTPTSEMIATGKHRMSVGSGSSLLVGPPAASSSSAPGSSPSHGLSIELGSHSVGKSPEGFGGGGLGGLLNSDSPTSLNAHYSREMAGYAKLLDSELRDAAGWGYGVEGADIFGMGTFDSNLSNMFSQAFGPSVGGGGGGGEDQEGGAAAVAVAVAASWIASGGTANNDVSSVGMNNGSAADLGNQQNYTMPDWEALGFGFVNGGIETDTFQGPSIGFEEQRIVNGGGGKANGAQ